MSWRRYRFGDAGLFVIGRRSLDLTKWRAGVLPCWAMPRIRCVPFWRRVQRCPWRTPLSWGVFSRGCRARAVICLLLSRSTHSGVGNVWRGCRLDPGAMGRCFMRWGLSVHCAISLFECPALVSWIGRGFMGLTHPLCAGRDAGGLCDSCRCRARVRGRDWVATHRCRRSRTVRSDRLMRRSAWAHGRCLACGKCRY